MTKEFIANKIKEKLDEIENEQDLSRIEQLEIELEELEELYETQTKD